MIAQVNDEQWYNFAKLEIKLLESADSLGIKLLMIFLLSACRFRFALCNLRYINDAALSRRANTH